MLNVMRSKFNKQIIVCSYMISLKSTQDLLWLLINRINNTKNKYKLGKIYKIRLYKVNFLMIQMKAKMILVTQKTKTHKNNIHKKIKT